MLAAAIASVLATAWPARQAARIRPAVALRIGGLMSSSQTLPARMYLLAYDLDKDRLTKKAWLPYLVRGAALAQLLVDRHVADAGGAVRRIGELRPAYPVLDRVLQEVERDKPRAGEALAPQRAHLRRLQEQLTQAGVTRVRGSGEITIVDQGRRPDCTPGCRGCSRALRRTRPRSACWTRP